ncbi:junction-mediating and -regulatory protein-like [Osmerus eperlanus]|uniref:junction-mediating and -regulatory protein-like n=1 Tax=Osmerus eperlanus TaxID=29151 RepID=UPI002E0E9C40
MSFAMEDNLESDWVAVRPNAFDEKEKHKFVFIVAWNEVEGRFAITCHNRTVQRKSIILGKDPLTDTATAGAKEDTTFLKSPVKDKTPKSQAKVSCAAGKGPTPKTKSPSKAAKTSSPSKTPVVSKTAAFPARSPDFEVLKPDIDALPSTQDNDTLGLDEFDCLFREDCSWAGLFSFQDLRIIHLQLCSVNSDLEPCLPPFPEELAGMWTVLFGPAEVTQTEMDDLCYRLQVYLGHALDTCGWKILSQVLFTESDDPEKYYESLSELRQSGYEEALQRAKTHLHKLLEQHRGLESMVELLQVYKEEDQAYDALLEAATQLYQYLLQPFRDMRELAMLRRQQIKISMENDYLGPRRIESLKKEDCDWQMKAQEAVLNIQQFTVRYFEITARAQKAVYERMRVDQRKLGKAAWTAAVERMERLQYSVAKETLQLQRAREICLEQQKHTLKKEMQSLSGDGAMERLDLMEGKYYDLQLQLYDIQADILQGEEMLLTAQLDSIRRQMTECQDQVVYYDTYESVEGVVEEEHTDREELKRLQLSARQLEARRGRITAKRTYLKHKREICVSNHGDKQQRCPRSQQDIQQEEEEDEERRNSRVSLERQKTLDRLRNFKQRYPGQVILKSTRLRASQSRGEEKGGEGGRGGENQGQTRSLSTSVQTDPSPVLNLPASLLPIPDNSPPSSPPEFPASPASPPPLPPPPPPPPPPQEGTPLSSASQAPGPGEAKGETGPPPLSPLGPFLPRFFDSSQLVNARKRLRKTSPLEAHRRKVSSPMDEVLASLKRGSFQLRRVDQRGPAPGPEDDPDNILVQIRRGVKLRCVPSREARGRMEDMPLDPLTRSIHQALQRIKDASPDSDSDDEGLLCPDWES